MTDQKWIESPPAGADGWREVWREDRQYRAGEHSSSLTRALGGFAQRILDRLQRSERARQRDFNEALLDIAGDLRRDLEAVRGELRSIERNLASSIESVQRTVAADIARIETEIVPILARRNDALVAAIDRKIESVAVRIRDLTNQTIAESPNDPSRFANFVYRRLEDGMRGSTSEVRESFLPYLKYASEQPPVIDIGCGRGEFLALCREQAIEARGFDTNERSIADLRASGYAVDLKGIPDCFDGIDDGSVGTILAAHIVEHLPFETLLAFFKESERVLRSGGFLAIETPNAESMSVSAGEFWRDPTHLAPRPAAALVLIARELRFEVEQIATARPFPEERTIRVSGDDRDLRRVVDRLNTILFGGQDLRLVLRKPAS